MKFTKQQIQIKGKKEILTIDASVNGVWAYHKSLISDKPYTVTHIPTSLAIHHCVIVKEARHLIKRLSKAKLQGKRFTFDTMTEYSKAKNKYTTPIGKWAEKILKPIVYDHKENYWKRYNNDRQITGK